MILRWKLELKERERELMTQNKKIQPDTRR
jgi:hypothetical protein